MSVRKVIYNSSDFPLTKMWFKFLSNAVKPFYKANDERDEGACNSVYALLRHYHGNI